jgi:hypothetical protein
MKIIILLSAVSIMLAGCPASDKTENKSAGSANKSENTSSKSANLSNKAANQASTAQSLTGEKIDNQLILRLSRAVFRPIGAGSIPINNLTRQNTT